GDGTEHRGRHDRPATMGHARCVRGRADPHAAPRRAGGGGGAVRAGLRADSPLHPLARVPLHRAVPHPPRHPRQQHPGPAGRRPESAPRPARGGVHDLPRRQGPPLHHRSARAPLRRCGALRPLRARRGGGTGRPARG
ncbi:MAG: Choline-sulfatase, partial [uncultured Thermomicrobiales bacterium]